MLGLDDLYIVDFAIININNVDQILLLDGLGRLIRVDIKLVIFDSNYVRILAYR